MNLVFLVGASYLGLSRESSGSADLEKLVGITPEGKQEAADQLDAWYGELTDPAQELLGGIYDGLSGWLRNDESSLLHYRFDQKPVLSSQYDRGGQLPMNHRWHVQQYLHLSGQPRTNHCIAELPLWFSW
jgi:hypothetical protein